MTDQRTLFENDGLQPLAARLRPQTLEEFVGQKHLLGEGKVLHDLLGAARRGKNDPRANHRPSDASEVY